MATIKRFEDLEIWKLSRELSKTVFIFVRREEFSKDFKLINQINSASGSVMDNIAEGFERGGNQEFVQFLYIAKSSCGEARSQLYVALDQKYLEQNKVASLLIILKRLSVMIKHLIDHLKRSGLRGPKYGSSNQSRPSDAP